MDFLIEENLEEINKEENNKMDGIISGYLTFIDFDMFKREYLKFISSDSLLLKGIGEITLQTPNFEKENDYPKL